MKNLPTGKAFTLIEPGPVVLVTTNDGRKGNVMAISWTMVLDFTAKFAITNRGVELLLCRAHEDEGVRDQRRSEPRYGPASLVKSGRWWVFWPESQLVQIHTGETITPMRFIWQSQLTRTLLRRW
jgi:hypothetical protein